MMSGMAALDAKAPAGLDPSHIDALVEVMLLAASVDGRLDDAEVEPLRQMLLSIDEQCLTRVSLEQRLLEAAKRIDASPRDDRFAALRDALPRPEQRLAALELAIRVVAADRQIQTSEHELVLEVAQQLEIDSRLAGELIMRRLY
jgi:uncharacterized tellurite resistance protein B-like protein